MARRIRTRRLLRDDILDHLRAKDGHATTIGALTRKLGHSHGAYRAAMLTLQADGLVRGDDDTSPRIYRLTDKALAAPTDTSSGADTPVSTRPDTTAVAALRTPVLRPNGTAYHPRRLGPSSDVLVLRQLRAAGMPVLLYGPPGTGKTSLVEAAFGDQLLTVAGDGDTAVADLVGEYTQTDDGRYRFIHGPLVTAMRDGQVLFLDDATLISPKVLAVVYPAMDGRRQITIKAHGNETVTAADGFYVVAGHNPGVHGAVLTDALSSRFSAQIAVGTDYDLAAGLGIDARAVRAARNLAVQCRSGSIGWAPQLRELLAFDQIAAVLGAEAAVANLLGAAPSEDRDVVADILATTFGETITPLHVGRQL